MILERPYILPYAYTVKAHVNGRRSTRSVEFVTTGKVEGNVREVSLRDAPVVLEWASGGAMSFIKHEMRYFDGGFYMPANAFHEVTPARYGREPFGKSDIPSPANPRSGSGYRLASLISERAKTTMSKAETLVTAERAQNGYFIPAVLDSDIREIVDTNEDDRRDAAGRLLADMLVVRRDLWIRVEEPRFILRSATNQKEAFGGMFFGRRNANDLIWNHLGERTGGPGVTRFFGLEDFEAFRSASQEEGIELPCFGVILHDRAPFKTDWDLNNRARLVDYTVRTLASRLGDQSPSTIAAWLEAKTGYSAFLKTGDAHLVDRIIEGPLSQLVSSYRGEDDLVVEAEKGMQAVISRRRQEAGTVCGARP